MKSRKWTLLNSYLKELNEGNGIDEEAFYEERRLNNQRFEELTKSVANDYTMFEEKRCSEDRKRQELIKKRI